MLTHLWSEKLHLCHSAPSRYATVPDLTKVPNLAHTQLGSRIFAMNSPSIRVDQLPGIAAAVSRAEELAASTRASDSTGPRATLAEPLFSQEGN